MPYKTKRETDNALSQQLTNFKISQENGRLKLYAGKDNYTFDDFRSTKIAKYFAVFSYDDVANYSEPLLAFYEGQTNV